jgi:hypothetical protein
VGCPGLSFGRVRAARAACGSRGPAQALASVSGCTTAAKVPGSFHRSARMSPNLDKLLLPGHSRPDTARMRSSFTNDELRRLGVS